jgi:hypothetical protein
MTTRWHRPLLVLAAAMAVLLVACLVGLVVDSRTVTGLPVWAKPAKFALSTLIYAVTWAWLIALVREHRPDIARRVGLAGTVAAVLLGVELVIIAGQALRGTTSHFNGTTAFDRNLFVVMAVSIVAVWLASAYIAAALFRVRSLDPARALAIRAGSVLAVVGMGLAFLMTRPFPGQIEAGGAIIGAHTVGLPDGGPGLPLLGWSTVGGDLRIPHFVGMHALQVLPLVLIALELLRVPVAVRTRLVAIAAVAYTLVLSLLTWQSLRGQSIVAPDALTVGTAIAIGVGTLVAAAIALGSPRANTVRPG